MKQWMQRQQSPGNVVTDRVIMSMKEQTELTANLMTIQSFAKAAFCSVSKLPSQTCLPPMNTLAAHFPTSSLWIPWYLQSQPNSVRRETSAWLVRVIWHERSWNLASNNAFIDHHNGLAPNKHRGNKQRDQSAEGPSKNLLV